MKKINKFKVRALSAEELKSVENAYCQATSSIFYLFSIFASGIVGIQMVIKLIQGNDILTVLCFYGSIILLAWIPSILFTLKIKKRRRWISSGKASGIGAICIDKVKLASHQRNHSHRRTRYTISTELGEVNTFIYNEVVGKTIEAGDHFYLVRTTPRDTFFLKI